MKVATWNVNGIRAREAQLCDWVERDRPDVVCLQEIKARPDQVPDRCKLADYHAFWHGGGGYSGVSLHIRREVLETPEFSHPEFDMETRIVQVALGNVVLASVYVPNGGKDYDAKIRFLTALAAWTERLHDGGRDDPCGESARPADIDVHPKGARRASSASGGGWALEALLGANLVDARELTPTIRHVHGGRRAQHAPAQHRLADDTSSRSRAIAERATSRVSSRIGTSDHAPLMMMTAD